MWEASTNEEYSVRVKIIGTPYKKKHTTETVIEKNLLNTTNALKFFFLNQASL